MWRADWVIGARCKPQAPARSPKKGVHVLRSIYMGAHILRSILLAITDFLNTFRPTIVLPRIPSGISRSIFITLATVCVVSFPSAPPRFSCQENTYTGFFLAFWQKLDFPEIQKLDFWQKLD